MAGIPICNGSDLLGDMRKYQSAELVICAQKLVCCAHIFRSLLVADSAAMCSTIQHPQGSRL